MKVEFNKQVVEVYPRVVWTPFWAVTFADVKAKVGKLKVSQKSTLLLEGADIELKDVRVDGALVVKPAAGAKVGMGMEMGIGDLECNFFWKGFGC